METPVKKSWKRLCLDSPGTPTKRRYYSPNFPNRDHILCEMLRVQHPKLTEKSIKEQVQSLDQVPNVTIQVDTADLQWRASMDKKQPWLAFLLPPVNTRLVDHCSGKLYGQSNDVRMVTIYTLQGPKPGLKAKLSCRSCDARYHVTDYRTNHGEVKFYCNPSQYISASNRVLFTRDLHEFICESAWVITFFPIFALLFTTNNSSQIISSSG